MVRKAIVATPMTACDAKEVAAMMGREDKAYLQYFTPFADPLELVDACRKADEDVYMTLYFDGQLAGFYMLRGWDEGYTRPAFGIYVASHYQGRNIAKFALSHAEIRSRSANARSLMLKVNSKNKAAVRVYTTAGFEVLKPCDVMNNIMMEKVL